MSLTRYRYIGKERDEETGFYYMGARYYVPWLCRWMAVDPKESERPGLSSYDYCSNNPINRIDPDGMKDGGWYTDTHGKAHFLEGVQFPDQFKATHLKGKFFGVIQGEYNADGTHTKPHYLSNAQSKPQHSAAKPTAPAKHASAPAKASAPTPAEQFGTGFKQGAVENLQSLKDAVTTPTGLATLAGGAALIYFIPGLGEVAMVATVGYMAYKAATAAENLHEGNYHEAGRGAGSLTVDVAVILATEGAGKLGAGSKTEEAVNTVDAAKKGWKVGEPITNLTGKGKVPAWSTVRQRFWKNEAFFSKSGEYEDFNLLRMQKGLAPQFMNPETGLMESMELHHNPPQRNGGLFEIEKVTPEQHRLKDNFRR